MSKILPYIILHIRLDEPVPAVLLPLIQTSGYYCIFWWTNIPLGELFIEPKSSISKEGFERMMEKAIQPAIDFYVGQGGIHDKDGRFSPVNDREAFAGLMDAVSARYISTTLPEVVDVSIVICTRNRSSSLKRCLDMLQNQKSRPYEIIVIDNAPSDDSSYLVVQQFGNGIKYFKEPRPGLDIARNTGATTAQASVVAYVDDDVLVHPMWTYQIWKTFSDPDVAALTGLVIASELNTESQQIFEKYWSFNRGYVDQAYDHDFITKYLKSGPPVWEIGAGANMAFRKSVFEQVGYFDERLDVGAAGCSGDSELWYRILLKGLKICYNPRAVVFHEHRRELDALHNQLFNYMRGHAASALIQQELDERAGYRKRIYKELPNYYRVLLRKGFPFYKHRYRTLLSEWSGLLSGIRFYRKHKSAPLKNFPG